MCVDVDKAITRQLKQRKRPFKAWKDLSASGRSLVVYREYGPGVADACCVVSRSYPRYHSDRPHGLHVWRAKKDAGWFGCCACPVSIDPRDIIAADHRQIAVRKLVIDEKDWLAAGLPKRPVKRRVV